MNPTRSVSRPASFHVERFISAACWMSALAVCGIFGWLLFDIVKAGCRETSWVFLTAEPINAGRGGGIGTVLVSTVLVLGVCLVVAVPVGVGTAVWLSEFTRQETIDSRFVRRSVEFLAAVPSIIFGLFGMVFFCQKLNLGFSILSGGLTLACMVLPIVIQTTHAGLRSASDELRSGAAAVGLSQTATLWHLLLPAATHGVVVGLMLSIGRAMAETAALIFTSGYVTRMPESLLDSGRTLSVHIYDLAINVPGAESRAYATAFVLVVILLLINSVAGCLADVWLKSRQAI